MTCILDHRPIPTRLWLQPISRTNGASFSSPVYVSKKAFMLQRLEAKIPPPPSLDIHSCHLDRPPCHLERSERSHAAIIRSEKSILGTTRLLASLRNDSGGCISANALSGTTNFRIRLSCTVIAAFLHCRLRFGASPMPIYLDAPNSQPNRLLDRWVGFGRVLIVAAAQRGRKAMPGRIIQAL